MKKYIIISITVLVLLGSLSVGIVHSDNDEKYTCPLLRDCAHTIVLQNNEIIEKLDWNNCALLHKIARGYNAPSDLNKVDWGNQRYYDLIRICGNIEGLGIIMPPEVDGRRR